MKVWICQQVVYRGASASSGSSQAYGEERQRSFSKNTVLHQRFASQLVVASFQTTCPHLEVPATHRTPERTQNRVSSLTAQRGGLSELTTQRIKSKLRGVVQLLAELKFLTAADTAEGGRNMEPFHTTCQGEMVQGGMIQEEPPGMLGRLRFNPAAGAGARTTRWRLHSNAAAISLCCSLAFPSSAEFTWSRLTHRLRALLSSRDRVGPDPLSMT